eukprot:3726989-Amphidinium_carterae.1
MNYAEYARPIISLQIVCSEQEATGAWNLKLKQKLRTICAVLFVCSGGLADFCQGEAMKWSATPGTTGITVPVKALHGHATKKKAYVEALVHDAPQSGTQEKHDARRQPVHPRLTGNSKQMKRNERIH